jgi:hypothetical protein
MRLPSAWASTNEQIIGRPGRWRQPLFPDFWGYDLELDWSLRMGAQA